MNRTYQHYSTWDMHVDIFLSLLAEGLSAEESRKRCRNKGIRVSMAEIREALQRFNGALRKRTNRLQ